MVRTWLHFRLAQDWLRSGRVAVWFGCRIIGMSRILPLVSRGRQHFFQVVKMRVPQCTTRVWWTQEGRSIKPTCHRRILSTVPSLAVSWSMIPIRRARNRLRTQGGNRQAHHVSLQSIRLTGRPRTLPSYRSLHVVMQDHPAKSAYGHRQDTCLRL